MNHPEVYTLFSSPVYKKKLDHFDPTELVERLDKLEYERTDNQDGYMSKEQALLLREDYTDIRDVVESHLKFYLYEILKVDKSYGLKHACSWAIYHQKEDWCFNHLHSNSLFSGVFYVRVPEGSGEVLNFSCPQSSPTWAPCTLEPNVSEFNIFNAKNWGVEVSDGTMVLFPSHVLHSVPVSKSEEKRRCISFNYFLTGKFGLKSAYAEF